MPSIDLSLLPIPSSTQPLRTQTISLRGWINEFRAWTHLAKHVDLVWNPANSNANAVNNPAFHNIPAGTSYSLCRGCARLTSTRYCDGRSVLYGTGCEFHMNPNNWDKPIAVKSTVTSTRWRDILRPQMLMSFYYLNPKLEDGVVQVNGKDGEDAGNGDENDGSADNSEAAPDENAATDVGGDAVAVDLDADAIAPADSNSQSQSSDAPPTQTSVPYTVLFPEISEVWWIKYIRGSHYSTRRPVEQYIHCDSCLWGSSPDYILQLPSTHTPPLPAFLDPKDKLATKKAKTKGKTKPKTKKQKQAVKAKSEPKLGYISTNVTTPTIAKISTIHQLPVTKTATSTDRVLRSIYYKLCDKRFVNALGEDLDLMNRPFSLRPGDSDELALGTEGDIVLGDGTYRLHGSPLPHNPPTPAPSTIMSEAEISDLAVQSAISRCATAGLSHSDDSINDIPSTVPDPKDTAVARAAGGDWSVPAWEVARSSWRARNRNVVRREEKMDEEERVRRMGLWKRRVLWWKR